MDTIVNTRGVVFAEIFVATTGGTRYFDVFLNRTAIFL